MVPSRSALVSLACLWAGVGIAAGVATWHSGPAVLHAAQLAGPALALVSARLAHRGRPRRAGWALIGSALITPTFFMYAMNLVPLGVGLASAILGEPRRTRRLRHAQS
jgi:drug/metabolite transporter (DMT)-like permease